MLALVTVALVVSLMSLLTPGWMPAPSAGAAADRHPDVSTRCTALIGGTAVTAIITHHDGIVALTAG
jgi:hypothetical protein